MCQLSLITQPPLSRLMDKSSTSDYGTTHLKQGYCWTIRIFQTETPCLSQYRNILNHLLSSREINPHQCHQEGNALSYLSGILRSVRLHQQHSSFSLAIKSISDPLNTANRRPLPSSKSNNNSKASTVSTRNAVH